ncbi:MAG: flagellar biosynthesis protein FliQ [Deltaproteobacteria bacterium]|nr:flagellar biosynthesis protein FliQ [Deltaproteobacteria bacterium]
MIETYVANITREALYLTLIASAPPIFISLVVGFIISLFQATTQIQEQTLTFAPKIIIVFGVLALAGPWIGHQLLAFTYQMFDRFPYMVR